MAKRGSRRQLLVGFFFLGLLVVVLGFVMRWVLQGLLRVDPELGAALATGFVAVVVTVLSVAVSKYYERKSTVEQALREQKVPIYEKLIDFIFRITFAEKRGESMPSDQEMVLFMTELTRDLVIWGSPDVIRSFSSFKRLSASLADSGAYIPIMFAVEDVFRAIRKDLGHGDTLLKKGDILAIYINDIDQYI